MTETKYKYQLDITGKKYKCPSCGDQRFVRYVSRNSGIPLSDEVGRCDRENNCGYHYPPSEYFGDGGKDTVDDVKEAVGETKMADPDYISFDYLERSMEYASHTNFTKYLKTLFPVHTVQSLMSSYFIGNSDPDFNEDGSCIFWRIDKKNQIRTGKIMQYHQRTGKRDKETIPQWVHTQFKPYNLQLCFFGEHLLDEYPDKPVGIVESEKTAIIASGIKPEIIWLATGGKSGIRWMEYSVHSVLKDRKIILFPDYGYANLKTKKTYHQDWEEKAERIRNSIPCQISVSRILENHYEESERGMDYDLADLLIDEKANEGDEYYVNRYPLFHGLIGCNRPNE